jgi:hypothetical protein
VKQNGFIEAMKDTLQNSGKAWEDYCLTHDDLLAVALPVRVKRFQEVTKGIKVDAEQYMAYRATHPGPLIKVLPNPKDSVFNERAMKDHGVSLIMTPLGLRLYSTC